MPDAQNSPGLSPAPQPLTEMTGGQVFTMVVIAVAVAAVSWKASAYVGDHDRTIAENVTLKARVDELTKDNEKLTEKLQQAGYRPGTPIGPQPGNPAGSSPTGSTR